MDRAIGSKAEFTRISFILPAVFLFILLVLSQPARAQGGYDTSEAYGTASKEKESEVIPGGPPMGEEMTDEEKENQPKPEFQNTKPEPFATNDVQKWFDQYDDIRSKYETTPEESRYADYIMAKSPSAGLNEDEAKFMHKLTERYIDAVNKMKEVEVCSETERLHRQYIQFATEQAAMYHDYGTIINTPEGGYSLNGKPLTIGMQQRKQRLQLLERSNRMLDKVTRLQFQVSKNPYLPQPPPPGYGQ